MNQADEFDIPCEVLSRYSRLGANDLPDSVFARPGGVTAAGYAHALHRFDRWEDQSLSVYVHLPFCPVRCLNCGQNTTVTHDPSQIDRYLDGLEREMALVSEHVGVGTHLKQLHLGGGTPNYLNEMQLVRLMMMVEAHFRVDEQTETSLEASPKSASAAQLDLLHGLGFYRICFAVRDLDLDVQRAMGRYQSAEMLADVFCMARDSGFETVNMDLVYGLPSQTGSKMQETIDTVIALAPDQIQCRAFVLRPDCQPHQRTIDPKQVPSLAQKIAIFGRIVRGLTSARYTWVGVDGFAKDDDELAIAQAQRRLKRNWIGYSVNPAENLIGFGTNAVSEADGVCVQNHRSIDAWQNALAGGFLPVAGGFHLSETDRRRRDAMVELLCNLELRDYTPLLDTSLAKQTWLDLARDGLMEISANALSLTPRGRYAMSHSGLDYLLLSESRELQQQSV